MAGKTQLITNYFKEQGISIREAEKLLGHPNGYLKKRDGEFSDTAIQKIIETFKEVGEILTSEASSKGLPMGFTSENCHKKVGFSDGIPRYQDAKGLWRRYTEPDKGEFKPKDGTIHNDDIGDYFYLLNNIKVYTFL